jgi:hypothetical protein
VCVCVLVRAFVGLPLRVGVCMRVRACSFAYPACYSYAPYCDVICGPSGSTIFRHYLTNGTILEQKVTEHKTCVLIFSTTFV